ncbi:MAG TPA: amidohydrolase, partial [Candidatus Scatomorpha pullicola]|nr:amidohydrolase [Candidatus Scatomorpha pullicola]
GALGAAFAVRDFLEKSGHSGTVIFYGCPGEEGGAGKAFMAREGMWRELDCALTWHPSDVNEVVTGTNNSSIQVLYKFHGVSAHAAGDPENGRSALDAVELMNTGVQYLREHMTSDCRIHYAIIDAGGVSPNVVQSEASVLYLVRANKVRDSIALLKRVDKIAQGAALMTETSFDRKFIDGTAELVPNYTLEALLYRIFNEVGLPEYTDGERQLAEALRRTYELHVAPGIAAGFDADIAADVAERTNGLQDALCGFIMPEYHSAGFVAGSTDVGDVSWQTPAAQVHCVTFPFGAAGHSWQNVSCGGTSLGHKGLINAAKIIACAAIELMNDPETLQKARDEFARRTRSGYVCPIEPDAVPTAI